MKKKKKNSYFGSNSIEILARCPISSNNIPYVKQQQQQKTNYAVAKGHMDTKKKEEKNPTYRKEKKLIEVRDQNINP